MDNPKQKIRCDAKDCAHYVAGSCGKGLYGTDGTIEIQRDRLDIPTCASYYPEPEPEEPPTWPCCGTCRFFDGKLDEGPQKCGNPKSRVYNQDREYSWWCKCWTDGSE